MEGEKQCGADLKSNLTIFDFIKLDLKLVSLVKPGFLKNKTRLIIYVPRKSTHMLE
jgi:hypothetical protein